MKDELLTHIDEYDNVLGPLTKSQLKENPLIGYRASIVIPKSIYGNYILGKRSDKEPYPNKCMAGIGGLTRFEESYLECAVRECMEEVKLDVEKNNIELTPVTKVKYWGPDYNIYFEAYTTSPVNMSKLLPDPREIQYLKEFELDEIKELIKNAEQIFAPTFVKIFKEFYPKLKQK